jgi:hypothetical protein
MLSQNHVAEPNQHVLHFLHLKVSLQCTGGVALTGLLAYKKSIMPVTDVLSYINTNTLPLIS